MTDSNPDHWLWRLRADEWLAAANTELEQGRSHFGQRRTAITRARRAAGMGLNATLVAMAGRGWSRERCESVWGRSYIEHLRSLAATLDGDPNNDNPAIREPFDIQLCERCRELLTIPVMAPTGLVGLGPSKNEAATAALDAATKIVRDCAAIVGT